MIWDLWGERNDRVFRGRDKDPYKIRSLVRFHVSPWASVSKLFVTISLAIFYLVGAPSCSWDLFVSWFFRMPLFSSIFTQ